MTDLFGTDEVDIIQNAQPDSSGLFTLSAILIRNMVIFPRMLTPILIDSIESELALEYAREKGETLIAVPLFLNSDEGTPSQPEEHNFSGIATEIAAGHKLAMPDGRQSVLIEGRRRVEIIETIQTTPFLRVRAKLVNEPADQEDIETLESVSHSIRDLYEDLVDLNEYLPDGVLEYLETLDHSGDIADFIAASLSLEFEEQLEILNITNISERLRNVYAKLRYEVNLLEIKDDINDQIQDEFSRNQRELYLREQMRVIQTELGESDVFQDEITDLQEQIANADLNEEAQEKATKELVKLQMLPPIAPEVGMIRSYIESIVSIPWTKQSNDNLDVLRAERILNQEHHGLSRVKDRILEHIAVRKLAADKMKTPILCFAGPPGVGKTSMGKSIASALGREFVRVSLGGVRDEAEIRGHRRTYIGAMPGRIIQTMQRAGTINPVFMLDEIDKVGADFRGDPAAALLEALDPEQNMEFSDHYLDMPYDLSKVMFITTANDLYPLPPALLDRMEVIEFPGYTEEDKLEIARKFLIPKQLEANGIKEAKVRFETKALQTMIREYTYEAGVRNFEREIGKVSRKIARMVAEERAYPKRITPKQVNTLLGPPEFIGQRANSIDTVGVATGLAWTSGGGDILMIEVALLPGKGSLTLTGQLGEVMQESAQTALSYMRSRARDLDVPSDDFENYDVHVHLPEGSIPKDGPSAGITLAAALISAFTERKVRSDYAMTGEITLLGRVLPVGGIKEKLLAARRNNVKNIILPDQNRKDMEDVPIQALRDLNLRYVDNMQQVMDIVLLEAPPDGRDRDRYQDEDKNNNSDDIDD